MDYNNEEYLNLFKQVKNSESQNNQMLRETPNYQNTQMLKETPNYENCQNLNEVRRQPQNLNYDDFQIETRINGRQYGNVNEVNQQQFSQQENLNEIRRQEKQERLNEVYRIREQERLKAIKEEERIKEEEKLNEIKKQQEEQNSLNEVVEFKDVEYVTLEMFNKARYNSMMMIAKKTIK